MNINEIILRNMEDLWLTQEEEREIVVGKCSHCEMELVTGNECFEFEGDLFCDKDCFCEWSGLKHIEYLEKRR